MIAGSIKIGFLTPYSGIYPYYGHHLMAGMLLGIYPGVVKKNEIQFIPAYTKLGDPASVREAVRKLLFFDNVDVVSGLINYKSVPDILPVIEQHHKIGFFVDMGEYIPWFNFLSPRIFYSSQQVWQSQYALGYWAGQEYGDGGLIVMTLYEGGYHISNTFGEGVKDAGLNRPALHILPHDKINTKVLNLDTFFEKIQKERPSYVHAIFTGDMGNEFLARWKESGYHKQIPLIVVENMVYDDMLQDVAALDLELFSASTWSRSAEDKLNSVFVKKFEGSTGQMANIFGVLGYEMGLAIREVKPLMLKRDMDKVAQLLQTESVRGPRGERNFYPKSGFSLPVTDIISVKTSINKTYKTVISQGKGLKFDSEEFKEIHEGNVSGWQNPYMCI